uniref:Serine/threonine-protein phosphatase n=1 Tax=Parastrongyloides trichosuri TaxID=131310 RepID=A0A0N4Z129_PARTI
MRRSSTTKERRTNKSSAKFERLKNFKDIQECTEYKREVSKGNLFSFITKKQKIEDKDNKESEGKPRRSVKNKAGSNDLSITQHVVSKSVGSIVPSEKSKKTNRDSCHTLVKRSSSATESTNINMKNSNNRIMFMRKTHSLNQRTPTDIKSSIFIRPTEFIGKRLLMSSISESNSSVSGRDELGGNTKSSDDDQPVTKTKKINISSIDVNNENDRLFKSQMKRFLMNLPKCKSSTVKIEEAFTWLSRYMDYIIIRKYNASYFASKEKNYLSNFFSESVIIRIIHHAAMIFESEPTLLELSIPNSMKEINVVSDIHGSMEDLMRAFGTCGTPGDSMYLFLGDYVDRGEYEVDIVMLLFLLKICYPKYIYLLRGNHEFYDINHRNQFPSHCRQSFSSGNYWKLLNFVFNRLSLAAIIENEIYCVHGGISQWITSRNSIKNLKKPYTDNVLLVERLIITDTVWSDPSPDLSERMFPASSRNVGFCFTKNGLKKVLKLLDVKMLLRGHQQPIDGFANEFGGICCTLHSRQLDITSNASTVKVFRDKKLNGKLHIKGLIYAIKSFSEDTKSMTHRRIHYIYHKRYTVFPNVIKTDENVDSNRITLILHISNDRNLSMIQEHSKNWKGSISLGVFMHNKILRDARTLCTLCHLKKYSENETNLSIHLIFNKLLEPNDDFIKQVMENEMYCEEYFNKFSHTNGVCYKKPRDKYEKIERLLSYPINVVKNVARNHQITKFIIFGNTGYMFSKDFEKKVLPIAKERMEGQKNVLVLRSFDILKELSSIDNINKSLLRDLAFKRKVFFFKNEKKKHFRLPKLKTWLLSKEGNASVQFIYNDYPIDWDPIFIMNNNVDYYIEEINFPSEDNVNLRWQMCKNNFKFLVLNDVFVYKFGWKNEEERELAYQARKIAKKINSKVVKLFKEKFNRRFPNSKRKCYE